MTKDEAPTATATFSFSSVTRLLFPDVFYGYFVVAGCIACRWSVLEGHSPWQGVFDQALIRKFGVGDETISALWSVALLVSCCVTPLNGLVFDQLGARLTLLLYAPLFLGGLTLLANADSVYTVGAEPTCADTQARVTTLTLQTWPRQV